MRWLYHVVAGDPGDVRARLDAFDRYTPESFAREGFIHASFRDRVRESARLYFPAGSRVSIVPVDPRKLDVAIEIAETPRGPMPHVIGSIPRAAIGDPIALDAFRESDHADAITF